MGILFLGESVKAGVIFSRCEFRERARGNPHPCLPPSGEGVKRGNAQTLSHSEAGPVQAPSPFGGRRGWGHLPSHSLTAVSTPESQPARPPDSEAPHSTQSASLQSPEPSETRRAVGRSLADLRVGNRQAPR